MNPPDSRHFIITWIDRNDELGSPIFPYGMDLDASRGDGPPHCHLSLTCPTDRSGYFTVACTQCCLSVIVSAIGNWRMRAPGRWDEPCVVRFACRLNWCISLTD